MAASNNTQIKVKDNTKIRLDIMKNNRTYDAVIADMLDYFDVTGIMPQSKIASPTTVVKEQASRVIEAVRGVEKTTNVRLKNIEQALSRLVSSQQTVNEYTPPEQNPDEFLHISQVQELLERAKEQERTIAKYRDEVSRLQGELEVSASKKTEVQSPVNLNKLLEVVERIDSMKKIPTFNDTVYEIDRNSFDLWIKRFKDELKQ